MTRIVAGTAGGRRLRVPKQGTRPTAERVREAMFSALESAEAIAGARVLDLYAGTGALGFEALSRGADAATFVESAASAAALLARNATELGFAKVDVVRAKAATMLTGEPRAFDLVFADPPYAVEGRELAAVLAALCTGWLAPEATVLVERAARAGEPPWPAGLCAGRSRRYGDTAVYWASPAEPSSPVHGDRPC